MSIEPGPGARTVPDTSAGPEAATLGLTDPPPDLGPADPAQVGPYRVLRKLGEGGMGAVYLAEQQSPRRPVALKVVRPGRVTPLLLQRFRLESQILGWLKHPAVAQVYEAGECDGPGGPQPYYAMEYVEGEPLTGFATGRGLDARRRLELFAAVCDGVEAAHQRGVIHRDLKPANILVTADGRPKILDFGIARVTATDGPSAEPTSAGQVIGTLNYMSPEQAGGDPAAVDTRTDVYALGVILYELLAGRVPIDVRGKPLTRAIYEICELDPTPLAAADRRFRGDLSAIAGKALAKRPADRYPSAAALAADVRRFLADRPIEARPPSRWVAFRKFARRNRALVGGVAVAAAALLAGTGFATYGLVEARREAKHASDESARATAAEADAVRRLAARTFAEAELLHARGEYEAALAAYDRARELGYPDEVVTRLRGARCLAGLGRAPEAVRVFDELAARPDLQGHDAELLLYRGVVGLLQGTAFEGDPVDLIWRAVAKGLPPHQDAFARGLLAPTLPEVVAHLEEAVRLAPGDSDAHGVLLGVLVLLGRGADAERVAGQLQALNPHAQLGPIAEALTAALRGDARRKDVALAEVARRWPDSAELATAAVEMLADFGRPGFLWEAARSNPLTLMSRATAATSKLQARMADRPAGNFLQTNLFKLPALRAVGELAPQLLAPIMAGDNKRVAELLGRVAHTWPTGIIVFAHGRFLDLAGDKAAARECYRRAIDLPSLIECRQVALCFYTQRLWYDAIDAAGTVPPRLEEPARSEIGRRVRELAALGPIPNDDFALDLGTAALRAGEVAAAVTLARTFLDKGEKDYWALKLRADTDLSIGAYGRAMETAEKMIAMDSSKKVGYQIKQLATERIRALNAKLPGP
jgi:tetratricopeptide (TPR) repeat protein/predicted Ser/Thr protein kinase